MDSNSGLKDISLTIYGLKKTIKGLTEYTLCDDVIETVFDTLAISNIYASSFAILESASGVERILSGKTRILKLVRSWGADHEKYELIMKRIDNLTDKVNKKPSGIENNKYTLCNTNNNVKDVTGVSNNFGYSEEKTPRLKRSKACSRIQNCSINSKNVASEHNMCEKLPGAPEMSGKMYILKKFMNDVMIYNNIEKNDSRAGFISRTPGDGLDVVSGQCLRKCHNAFSGLRNYHSNIRQAELDESVRTPGDGEHSTFFNESLNDAFVYSDSNNVKGNATVQEFSGLNDAFIVTGEDCIYDSDNDSDGPFKYNEVSKSSNNGDSKSCSNFKSFGINNDVQKWVEESNQNLAKRQVNGLSDKYQHFKHILASVSSGTPSTSSSEDSLIESFMNTKLHEEKSFRQYL